MSAGLRHFKLYHGILLYGKCTGLGKVQGFITVYYLPSVPKPQRHLKCYDVMFSGPYTQSDKVGFSARQTNFLSNDVAERSSSVAGFVKIV